MDILAITFTAFVVHLKLVQNLTGNCDGCIVKYPSLL